MLSNKRVSLQTVWFYFGLVALEPMGLVDDEDGPVDRAETADVERDHFVAGEQHVELDGLRANS